MTTLSSWLAVLGLERYIAVFEANGIDLRSLPLLGDGELTELGVLLGHRRLLQKQLSNLEPGRPGASDFPAPAPSAERRQLTILFCDLVASTTLAQKVDPETLREVMRDYQTTCAEVVARYGGHVAQYRGDSLEVYFGWPNAHEDDAERAVRAALDIVPAVNILTAPQRVRIGIATGLVVIAGRSTGDSSLPSAAVGQTPNLAARLQALAEPDQIIIAPDTHRLVGRTFEVDDLGERNLKGIDHPVRPQRVRRLAPSDSRFVASRDDRYTPFVGREEEIAFVLSRWRQACDGEGQVVFLVGEAGIGKSRIAQVLRERIADSDHLRLQYQCSPYDSGSAYFPIIDKIEREAGFARDDSVDRKLDKLEAALDLDENERSTVTPLFAALLSLPVERYPPRMLSPQKHRELTVDALAAQPLRLAKRRPVLMIFEDLHWCDPSTLETLARLVDAMRHAPVLLLITCRPERVPAWPGHGHLSSLLLNRLARRHGEAMTVSLTGGRTLPREVLARVLEQADGVPLFVEELTKSVLELGLLIDAGDRLTLDGPLPPRAIPQTLQGSLTARLDRLGPIKELAQVGACIGRQFDQAMLAVIVSVSGIELERALSALTASGLLFRSHSGAQPTFSFKHAMVQEVAYGALLKTRRQDIHKRIAHSLLHEFKDRARAQPELLALHLTRAGLVDEALPQWRTAVRSAIANNRHREALAYVEAGLSLVDSATVDESANHEVALLAAGAACHWVLTGYACQPATDLLAKAEAALDRVTDDRLRVLALGGILIGSYVRAETAKALASGERLDALGRSAPNVDQRITAFALASTIFAHQGQFDRSRSLLNYVVDHYETARRFTYGRTNDPLVNARVWLSWIDVTTGHVARAKQHALAAVEHAMAIAEPFVLSQALSVGALVFAEAGDCSEALLWCRRCDDLCIAQDMPFWQHWSTVHEGVALARLGEHEQAHDCFERALTGMRASGGRNNVGYMYARQALALARLGRFDAARRSDDSGRADCDQTGQLLMLSELALARGVTERLDPSAPAGLAEEWLLKSLHGARGSGMRLVELRAAIELAEIAREQGKTGDAEALLTPICDAYATEPEFADLVAARSILDTCGRANGRNDFV